MVPSLAAQFNLPAAVRQFLDVHGDRIGFLLAVLACLILAGEVVSLLADAHIVPGTTAI